MTELPKILVVDDIEQNLIALEALLRRNDAQIVAARSGAEALELVLVHEFALALVDVQMPDMDGFELAELMRGAERSKYIPIIFVTAGGTDMQRVFRGYETGAVDFLFKPIDPHILRHKADTFLMLQRQKKQLTEQLIRIQQSEGLLRAIMNSTTALIHVKDVSGRYLAANKRFETLCAHTSLVGRDDQQLFEPGTAAALSENHQRALQAGGALQIEEHIEHAGEHRIYLSSKTPLRFDRGELWGICTVATDVTDLKRMEVELAGAVSAREDVLAVVSHDLRNFLQSVRSGVNLLSKGEAALGERTAAKIYEQVRSTVDLMSRMIADLTDMANIRSGRIEVALEPEELHSIIHEALATHEPIAREKGIEISAQLGNEPVHVACDRGRVLQALANLLGNSVKFCSPGDRVTLAVRTLEDQAQVSIADSGPGIAPADLPRVFAPYWSASANRRRGTGLGLYITKRIVEAHASRIWIESDLGHGTAVHFTLPLCRVASGNVME